MEALYFLKFWRPSSTSKENQPTNSNSESTEIQNSMVDDTDDEIDEEEEDSFFELELTVPDFDISNKRNSNATSNPNNNPPDKDSNSFDSKAENIYNLANKADNAELKFQHTALSLSPNDHNLLSKRKILPIEHISKPQSPISLLKSSAPRFRVLMFKKSKSMHKTEKTELNGDHKKQNSSKLFTVKFKLEEEPTNVSMFTRENSLRKRISDENLSSDDSSKRFSLEVLQKYLKLIKPLYIKVSKKQQSEKTKQNGELMAVSPSCSPAAGSTKKEKQGNIPAGIRVVCRHLGKSKSASATNGVMPATTSRRDDSLLLQHDGIQSAILHCKNSFHSSRDSSLLSRFASDPMTSPRVSNEGNAIN